MRLPTIVFLLLVGFSLLGCKSKCRQLSEALCDCAVNSVDNTNCLTRVASNEANSIVTADDELRCDALLPGKPGGCDCRLIDTPAGKAKCGLTLFADMTDAGQ